MTQATREHPAVTRLFFENALLPDGWAEDVLLEVDGRGWISAVTPNGASGGAHYRAKSALPGMPNVHSHAFQRAMAGLAEVRGTGEPGFWGWRELMYRFLERITPSDLTAIARQTYVEMLEAGFTAVVEFHYLHHDPAGRPYGDPGAMSAALAEAAADAGIGLTLLPVFYANGGFGGAAPVPGQRRFVSTPGGYARLLERAREITAELPDAATGIAPHSLRAVTPESLAEVLALAGQGPVHLHIAEQTREVEECLAWCGARPVEWLLGNADVNGRWCLVHATHITGEENRAMAASGAVAGLCPVTEANLGDGIFPAVEFVRHGGRLAVGTDSNIHVGVAEELRLLEYAQRLRDRERNLLAEPGRSTGRSLYDRALDGGETAAGRGVGRLAPGFRADIVALDTEHPALLCRGGDGWLDGWLFAADNRAVAEVWVGGKRVVAAGRHFARRRAKEGFRAALKRLLG